MVYMTFIGLVSSNVVPTITVKPGQLIQAAIDAARAGATILVKAGTYAEQLTIKKDNIALVGEKGTILVPPTVPVPDAQQNQCFGTAGPGTIAGICVIGTNVVIAPYPGFEHSKVISVGKYVKGVSITNFEVHGFSGENIALYGAQDATVKKNKLIDGQVYGLLTAGSINTNFDSNTVTSSGLTPTGFRYIAICSDNVSGARVWVNDIDGYAIALCVQTNSADVQHNHVTNACYGAFVDPGVNGAILRHNTIGPTNPNCATAFGVASGILVYGASNTDVDHNDVTGQTLGAADTPENFAVGIGVFDAPGFLAVGNQVNRNDLTHNDLDLALLSGGTGNVFKANTCTTPAALCT